MKSPATLPCLLAVGLSLAVSLPAAVVVNDGRSTNNLIRLSNINGAGDATAQLTVESNEFLSAVQTGTAGSFAVRSAWYAANSFPTTAVYSVSADFVPAEISSERHGGVMGWLNLATNKGIAFYVRPAGSDPSFRVSTIDFNAPEDNASANESQTNLFNLDGTPAAGALDSAWAAFGTNYVATNFTTFQLEFAAPTAADQAVVANATAHITAKVFQLDAATNSVPAGRTIELLTDLPMPDPTNHRFGYFAVWGSIFRSGETIGFLDNLSATGVSVPTEPPNPPALVIVQTGAGIDVSWPTDYTSFILQATDSLNPTNWVQVAAPNNLFSTPLTGTSRFFRLIKP